MMVSDSNEAYACARFHRRSSGFILAGIAVLAGIAGVLLHFIGPPPREPSRGLGLSLAQMCAGAGTGCIGAAILLNFLWGLTSRSRYYVTFFTGILIALPIVFVLPPRFGVEAAMAVILAGVALFFYEFGLFIETSSRGIKRVRRLPVKASREIPWDRVESVRADLRKITTYGVGGGLVEHENRVIVAGNGTRISLNSVRYDLEIEDLDVQVERARPFAVAATLRRVRNDGVVRLGPLELRRDTLLVKRSTSRAKREISPIVHVLAGLLTLGLWFVCLAVRGAIRIAKRPVRVPLEKIAHVTFEKGSLLIVAGRKMYVPLRFVPNGIYFSEILSALRSTEPVSRAR